MIGNNIKTYPLEYTSYRAMIARCRNQNCAQYKDYGGRGIKVCARWQPDYGKGFENFILDLGKRPSKQHSLDRIDNDKGYSKENCRWATQIDQVCNARSNILVTIAGETKVLKEWCRDLNLSYSTINYRIKNRGFTPEQALTTPITKHYSCTPRVSWAQKDLQDKLRRAEYVV